MTMPSDSSGGNKLPPRMPPTPRDFAAPSMSELVPFRSSKINIRKSGLLIPAAATALACVVLFSVSNFLIKMDVVTAYLLFIIFYACYVYSGLRKNLLIYLIPCAIVYLQLTTPLLSLFIYIFRTILPGHIDAQGGFLLTFVSHFFGAGMMEELIKAMPGLIGLVIYLRSRNDQTLAGGPIKPSLMDWLKVRSPLEGIMLGIASGAAFIYIETLFQYVPNTIADVAKTDGIGLGIAEGFALLLPRVLQSIIGHMGWAAISGYFIGLAALYPRSIIKLLAVGWIVPAALHGLWNAGSELGEIGKWISAVLSLLVFISCFLKAKQLDTARRGGTFVATDSIIVGAEPLPASAMGDASGLAMPEAAATAWGGLANLLNIVNAKATAAASAAAVAMPQAAPVGVQSSSFVVPQAPVAAAAAPKFALTCGANRFGILADQIIDLAVLFPTQGLAKQSQAEVTVNPKDATSLGLKNLSAKTWTVTTKEGAVADVAKGRSLKLVAGEKIAIGDCIIVVDAV